MMYFGHCGGHQRARSADGGRSRRLPDGQRTYSRHCTRRCVYHSKLRA